MCHLVLTHFPALRLLRLFRLTKRLPAVQLNAAQDWSAKVDAGSAVGTAYQLPLVLWAAPVGRGLRLADTLVEHHLGTGRDGSGHLASGSQCVLLMLTVSCGRLSDRQCRLCNG